MRRSGSMTGLLALPYLLWLVVFLLGPLVFVVVTGFQEKGVWGGIHYVWNLESFKRCLDPLYLRVLFSSLRLALLTAGSCLIIGYPMAWHMARLGPAWRKVALLLVMLPFMSNFVVRAYAVKFLIGIEGPLNHLLQALGVIESPLFMESPALAVWFGMVTNYLPFMVLPLYVALERFDISVLEAARDLGADYIQVCVRILWPLTRGAAITGFTLVFIPALGEFVIPDLMGGARTMYLGNLLAELFLRSRDWPFGAAMSVLMMVVMCACVWVSRFFLNPRVRDAGGSP